VTTWTILVATLGQRADRFRRLLDNVLPQLDAAGGEVQLCAFYNHGERPLGHVRHDLLEHASTPYVSFVDDDDELPEYHVAEVLSRLDGSVDYVGWQMQTYVDGYPLKPTYHSLRYNSWWENDQGYYRDVSHLNPMRTEVARHGDFRRGEPPEDVCWVDQVRPYVRTEAYVDRVMYYYRSTSGDSTWRGTGVYRPPYDRPVLDHSYLSYHPASST
jgi:hypothetical protein